MSHLNHTYTKEEIIASLIQANQDAERFFSAIPGERFFQQAGGEWSPAENLEHLVRSVQPLAQALRLPKLLQRILFGTAPAPSRSYETVREAYLGRLAAGAQAAGRYLPARFDPSIDVDAAKRQRLSQWSQTAASLAAGLKSWDERDLDRYVLPHPFLGKLTVREMLFFTIYHNMHHAAGVSPVA